MQIGKEDLWSIVNMELDLLPCLVDMTWKGVRIDQDKVERTRMRFLKEKKALHAEIKRLVGKRCRDLGGHLPLSKAF